MTNRFESFRSSEPDDGAVTPRSEQSQLSSEMRGKTEALEGHVSLQATDTSDRAELEKAISHIQSHLLLEAMAGKESSLGIDDVRMHDSNFFPKKVLEIKEDAELFVNSLPELLKQVEADSEAYSRYVELMGTREDKAEIMNQAEYDAAIEDLREALESGNSRVQQALRDHYKEQRLRSLQQDAGVERKEGPVEDPYRAIEGCLKKAQQQLEQEGLHEDAQNLAATISRVQQEIAGGKNPSEIMLWYKTTTYKRSGSLDGMEKVIDKASGWITKVPGLRRLISKDYDEPVRPAGGLIVRGDGSHEEFYTYSRFKKKGEKTSTHDLAGNDYDYVTEPQPGETVLAWEPSERGKEIIMGALQGGSAPKDGKYATSMGQSGIEYWTSEYHTSNVEFKVKRTVDLNSNQAISYASLSLFPPPYRR